MITAGLDAGNRYTKAVIFDGSRVIARARALSGFDLQGSAEAAHGEALRDAGLKAEELAAIMSTGGGGLHLAGGEMAGIVASARGAIHLVPDARMVIDIGAEEARVLKVDHRGRILDFAINERCAAGAGSFIEAMSRALGVSLEELSALSLQAGGSVAISAQCAVFAESEIISMIHGQVPRADIARAVHAAMAGRISPMVRRLGLEREIVMIGGLAGDLGFVRVFEEELGIPVVVPAEPEYVTALGAAIAAGEERRRGE